MRTNLSKHTKGLYIGVDKQVNGTFRVRQVHPAPRQAARGLPVRALWGPAHGIYFFSDSLFTQIANGARLTKPGVSRKAHAHGCDDNSKIRSACFTTTVKCH